MKREFAYSLRHKTTTKIKLEVHCVRMFDYMDVNGKLKTVIEEW